MHKLWPVSLAPSSPAHIHGVVNNRNITIVIILSVSCKYRYEITIEDNDVAANLYDCNICESSISCALLRELVYSITAFADKCQVIYIFALYDFSHISHIRHMDNGYASY